ncbi:MAG: hypothetical protein LBE13_11715 [Bacteroidales bacterium]|jgi:hypothetical protein|nr:hypothetical protein [Bacteroidales bacterium]
MKIKYILWSLLLWINVEPHTQAQIKAPSAETLKTFAASKTYIVLEDVMFSDFNANIEEAAQRHWRITPFEIISLSQFEKQCRTPQASFLMVVMGEYTGGFAKNSTFNMLTLMMGHKSGDVNKMPEILSIPLSYYVPDGDEEDYGYKLVGILEGLQYAVKNILSQKMTITNFKDVFNNYSAEVKTKELWVTKNDLASSVNTTEKIKSIYPYKVIITSEQAIQKAIDEKQNNVVFLHKVGNSGVPNATCLKLIINCADGKPLYGDYHSISVKEPNGLLPKDFKALQ